MTLAKCALPARFALIAGLLFALHQYALGVL